MLEQQRGHREDDSSGPRGFGDAFGETESAGIATVSHGPYAEQLPVGGMTIQEIRRQFGDRLDIDPGSIAILDGQESGEDTVVSAGHCSVTEAGHTIAGGVVSSTVIVCTHSLVLSH